MFFSTNEGIPGDGRCLFRVVAHGSCIRSGKPAPSKNLQRELADELCARAILLPAQDRVLTIRENARLQGFPDYYKLLGPIKERYIQVGNAVAVPVARALGYSLAMSSKGIADAVQPTFSLPPNFPNMQPSAASPSTDQESQ